GSTATFDVTLQNTGNVAIRNLAAAFSDTTKGYALMTAIPAGTGLAIGETRTVTVVFAPQSGNDGGPVTITFSGVWGSRDTAVSAQLALNGDGLGFSISVTPTLAFGDFQFDSPPTPPKTFQILNDGDLAFIVQTAMFTPDDGTATGEFAFTVNGTPLSMLTVQQRTLMPNQRLDVVVVPHPNNRIGAIGGHLDLHTNIPGATDSRVTITGNATAAILRVSGQVDFGAVDIDGTPPVQTVTITNMGTLALDLSSVSFAMVTGSSGVYTSPVVPSNPPAILPGTA